MTKRKKPEEKGCRHPIELRKTIHPNFDLCVGCDTVMAKKNGPASKDWKRRQY